MSDFKACPKRPKSVVAPGTPDPSRCVLAGTEFFLFEGSSKLTIIFRLSGQFFDPVYFLAIVFTFSCLIHLSVLIYLIYMI